MELQTAVSKCSLNYVITHTSLTVHDCCLQCRVLGNVDCSLAFQPIVKLNLRLLHKSHAQWYYFVLGSVMACFLIDNRRCTINHVL